MLRRSLVYHSRGLMQGSPQKGSEIIDLPTPDLRRMRLTFIRLHAKLVHCQIHSLFRDHTRCCVFHTQNTDKTGYSMAFLMVDHHTIACQPDWTFVCVCLMYRQESPVDVPYIFQGKLERWMSAIDLIKKPLDHGFF